LRAWAGRFYAAYIVLRALLLAAVVSASFVVVTSVAGAWVASTHLRVGLGLLAAVLLPLVLRFRLRRAVLRRVGHRPRLGGPWFLVAWNGLLLSVLCLGFSDAVGRSVRRRGDWFLGEVDGWAPRRYRRGIAAVALWMERFDLPPEVRVILADARPPDPIVPREDSPPHPGMEEPPLPPRVAWFHPLAGPPRAAPPNAACRFGAPRPGPRPPECELGHCGVDLVQPEGNPIHAAHDGVVLKVVRDEVAGGIAGRFVLLTHKEGAIMTSYVHLQDIRVDLHPGVKVKGGEVIGTLGRTGIQHSAAHLHFALATQQHGRLRYVDPEPLLRFWQFPGVSEDRSPDPHLRVARAPSSR
jgi:hypothetical protein